MRKKTRIKILKIGLLMLLILSIIATVYAFIKIDSIRTDKANQAILSGDLETGLGLCHEVMIDQYSDVCYTNYVIAKHNNDLTFDKDVCKKISDRRIKEKKAVGCYV